MLGIGIQRKTAILISSLCDSPSKNRIDITLWLTASFTLIFKKKPAQVFYHNSTIQEVDVLIWEVTLAIYGLELS